MIGTGLRLLRMSSKEGSAALIPNPNNPPKIFETNSPMAFPSACRTLCWYSFCISLGSLPDIPPFAAASLEEINPIFTTY